MERSDSNPPPVEEPIEDHSGCPSRQKTATFLPRITMNMRHRLSLTVLVCGTLLVSHQTGAQLSQQGSKLVGTGAGGSSQQGFSVALAADGNTALVGGPNDSSNAGSAWVWTRSSGVWTQQARLSGSGAQGQSLQGASVAPSADGNTAIVGGPNDNAIIGAVWVWTRSDGVWMQQGNKLVGSGATVGGANQGYSVSLSADGDTALVGGPGDHGLAGAAWVWTRSNGVWSQQGNKLIGSGGAGFGAQGASVSLSVDGNTAIVGGSVDNNSAGAAWVWTRSGSVWTQQGAKLVGSGAVGGAHQGFSVSLSGDGNTAIVGAPNDNGNVGASWIWIRSGSVWAQQGPKLAGPGSVGNSEQGDSVSLAGDGNTAIVGGPGDTSSAGSAWVWTRSGSVWSAQATRLAGSGAAGSSRQGSAMALSADGRTAIIGGPFDNSKGGAAWVFTVMVPARRHAINH
jgi:hypothetical protein